jgi:hypothetical protein
MLADSPRHVQQLLLVAKVAGDATSAGIDLQCVMLTS